MERAQQQTEQPYDYHTLHSGVGKYAVWKGIEEEQKPQGIEGGLTMTEEDLWRD